MQKFFPFKGISRSSDPLLSAEGECLELMNLRPCNGSMKPVPDMVSVALLPSRYSSIVWHEMSGCYICVTDDAAGTLHFYDKDWAPLLDVAGERLLFEELSGVRSVEAIGNILCCMTENGIRYIFYTEGTFIWLGESPAVPQLEVAVSSKVHLLTTEESFAATSSVDDFESSWRYNQKGFYDECIYFLNLESYYIDRALFRFALRLYDGSYIYCSHPVYVSDDNVVDGVGRDSDNFYSERNGSSDGYSTYNVKVQGFKPAFSFSNIELEPWKGVVVGIDLFTTGSIMGHKADTLVARLHNLSTGVRMKKSYEGYAVKDIDELWDEIASSYLFYKVAEFDINGVCTYSIKDVSPTNLQLQQSLNSAQIPASLSSLAARCSYTLNNRLHIASLREILFAGYDASSIKAVSEDLQHIEGIAIETKIRTDDGIAVVVKNYGSAELRYVNGIFELPPLLSYPDSRAFEMNVYVCLDTELFVKNFKLSPHKFLNQAQYLHKSGVMLSVSVESFFASGFTAAAVGDDDVLRLFSNEPGIHEVIYSAEDGCCKYEGLDFPPDEFGSLRVFSIPRDIADGDRIVFTISVEPNGSVDTDICNIPIDDSWILIGGSMPKDKRAFEERASVLKVSAMDNPFMFPAACTYMPSQTPIVAMASNTVELSQGRFGEHPLFVFCHDGIWVMSLDASGSIAYSACYPFSRDVCRNPDAVCCVDSGVVFVGQKGVMLISGNKTRDISEPLLPGNNTADVFKKNPAIKDIAALAGLQTNVSVENLDDFLKQCRITYNARHGEIIVSNELCDNCYVYSLKDALWSRISYRVSGAVSSCSTATLLQHSGNATRILALGDEQSGANRALLITRPLLWGTKLPKRIEQFMLHAYASVPAGYNDERPLLACYLLCSNDGVHFRILDGRELYAEVQDVRFPLFPTQSYKYYMFAVTGNIGASSLLTGVEADVSAAWNSRMR